MHSPDRANFSTRANSVVVLHCTVDIQKFNIVSLSSLLEHKLNYFLSLFDKMTPNHPPLARSLLTLMQKNSTSPRFPVEFWPDEIGQNKRFRQSAFSREPIVGISPECFSKSVRLYSSCLGMQHLQRKFSRLGAMHNSHKMHDNRPSLWKHCQH